MPTRRRLADGELRGAPSEQDATDLVEAIVGAARALDARTMSLLLPPGPAPPRRRRAWVEVFAPALRRVGDLWQEGRLGVQSEHLTSELLQSELRAVVRANRLRVAGLPVVLASADDEQHHLPLLALEAELARHGVASLFLGPRVPARRPRLGAASSRGRGPSSSGPRCRARRTSRSGTISRSSTGRSRSSSAGPGWASGVAAPEGPVVVTRVDDFGSAVRALVPERSAALNALERGYRNFLSPMQDFAVQVWRGVRYGR